MEETPLRRLWNCVPLALADAKAILRKRWPFVVPVVAFAVLVGLFDHRHPDTVQATAETGALILWWFLFADAIRRINPGFAMTTRRFFTVLGYLLFVGLLILICAAPAGLFAHHLPDGPGDPWWWLEQPFVIYISARLGFVLYLAAMSDDGWPITDSWALSGDKMLWPTILLAVVDQVDNVLGFSGRSWPAVYAVSLNVLCFSLIQMFMLPLWLRWMNVCREYNQLPRPDLGVEAI